MKRLKRSGLLFGLLLAARAALASEPDWTVVVYAGMDEEEISLHGSFAMRALLDTPLAPGVELLMEHDDHGLDGVTRTIRRGGVRNVVEVLPEHDSADPRTFNDFVKWAMRNARGKRKLFIVTTHAWGWKGIVQDFAIPGQPKLETMMQVRDFARIMRQNGFYPEVTFLDSCVLGNAEAIEDFYGDEDPATRYLIASQRETPYKGFPYPVLLRWLGDPSLDAREIAKRIPGEYAAAHARGGALAPAEGEFDVVTIAALDLAKWKEFREGFRSLSEALIQGGFKLRAGQEPEWVKGFVDGDSNADVVELLMRVRDFVPTSSVRDRATGLLDLIGYPEALGARTAESIELKPGDGKYFRAMIQADPYIASKKMLLAKATERFKAVNQDLKLPKELKYSIEVRGAERYLAVQGRVDSTFRLRVWLPGTLEVRLQRSNRLARPDDWPAQTLTRDRDVVETDQFPSTSFLLSEAHTQGAPFIHGIGINLKPWMDYDEENGADPTTGLEGPDAYRMLQWSRKTGWADAILFR